MSISIALLMAAIVLIAYWVGKLVGEANAYIVCAEETCKALEQLIEEKDL